MSITVRNTGNVALTPSFAVSGDFLPVSCLPAFISPQSTCTIFLRFAPTSLGPKTGTLTITSGAIGSPHVVPLSGTGVDVFLTEEDHPYIPPGFRHTSPWDLFRVALGGTATRTGALRNNSPNPVTIGSISVTEGFSQVNTCGAILDAGAKCSIQVSGSPPSLGPFLGTLTVTHDAVGSRSTVQLFVVGGVGNLRLWPSTLEFGIHQLQFGPQLVGTASATQSILLTNMENSTAAVAFSAVTASDGFVLTNHCGAGLPDPATRPTQAFNDCGISVRFSPTAAVPHNGFLTIVSDAPGSPHLVLLSGTGVTPFPRPMLTAISPDSRSIGAEGFGLTLTGTNFLPQSVVRWGGVDRPTTYVNNTTLTATIPASDLANNGTFRVSVFNPQPGGGVSNNFGFTVYALTVLTTKDLIYDRSETVFTRPFQQRRRSGQARSRP